MTPRPSAGEVTRALGAVAEGRSGALEKVFELAYGELERLARGQLGREGAGRTLATQGLVHEAYLRLVGGAAVDAESRGHFLAIASRVMRQILVDAARRRQAAKRGGDWQRVTFGAAAHAGLEVPFAEMVTLDELLDRLDEVEPRLRQVVEMRFFGGLEEREVAVALGLSTRTVQRDWLRARAWLHKELRAAGRD